MQSSKVKTLLIYNFLKKYSDADNPVSTTQLIELLSEHGITCERKSIYSDIKALNNINVPVLSSSGAKKGFYLKERAFEPAEIKLLIDAVNSAGFITPKKTADLTEKLKNLLSVNQANELTSQVYCEVANKCNNEEIYQLSIAYMSVCSFMQIPNMVHIAIQKMIQATGNMVAPMWFQIAGVVVNFVFDPILIFGIGIFPAMGIRGAAVATVAGYLLSMILAFALLLGKKQKVQVKIKDFHLKKQMIYRIFAFGLPSFIMNALSSFVVTFVNLFLVAYSDTAIAFFGAYFKVQQLIVMTVNGLIQGCLPVMRFNYGAGNSERLHSAFRYGTVLVTGMMILGTLAVLLFPAQILGLFMASEAMRSFGISAMRIMAASYLFCGLSTMISTYFQATEKVGSSMAIQLCRQMLFLVPALWCLDKLFQLNGIWLAFPVAETATLLVALVMMAWHRRKNIS